MASDPARRVFRAPSATVVMIAAVVVAIFLLGDAFLRAGVVEGVLLTPWVLGMLWLAYVFLYVSCVQTDAAGIRVRNPLRTTEVPWRQISDINMRWQLQIDLVSGGVVKSFGGPVAGRPGRPPLRRDGDDNRRREPPAVRDLELIREQWDAAIDRAPTGQVPAVQRSWDILALGALAVIVVWAVSAVLITGGPS